MATKITETVKTIAAVTAEERVVLRSVAKLPIWRVVVDEMEGRDFDRHEDAIVAFRETRRIYAEGLLAAFRIAGVMS